MQDATEQSDHAGRDAKLTIVMHRPGGSELPWLRFLLGDWAGEIIEDPKRELVLPGSLIVTDRPDRLRSRLVRRIRRVGSVGLFHVGDEAYRSRLDGYGAFAFVWRTHLHTALDGLAVRQLPIGPRGFPTVGATPAAAARRTPAERLFTWSFTGPLSTSREAMLEALAAVDGGTVTVTEREPGEGLLARPNANGRLPGTGASTSPTLPGSTPAALATSGTSGKAGADAAGSDAATGAPAKAGRAGAKAGRAGATSGRAKAGRAKAGAKAKAVAAPVEVDLNALFPADTGSAREVGPEDPGPDAETTAAFDALAESVFAPCGMGPAHLESSRIYAALELGAIPIVERRRWLDYFGLLLGDHPLPSVRSWDEAPALMSALLADQHRLGRLQAQVVEWWAATKARLAVEAQDDVEQLLVGLRTPYVFGPLDKPAPRWRNRIESMRQQDMPMLRERVRPRGKTRR